MKLAKVNFGKLHEFWSSSKLKQDMKIRMFKCGVLSVLAYGNAAWKLDDDTRKALRGWNARCLTRIRFTDRDICEETIDPTANLVNYIPTIKMARSHPEKRR